MPPGIGEPLFCFKKKRKNGFKKKVALLYFIFTRHFVISRLLLIFFFLFLVEISFYKSMQQTINFISYLHTTLTSVFLFLSHFAELLCQKPLSYLAQTFCPCRSWKQQQLQQLVYRRLDAACPSDLPLTVLWILPSAVAAARWAPDMLSTRLHSTLHTTGIFSTVPVVLPTGHVDR